MNKITAYLVPVLAFTILVVSREWFEISRTVFLGILLLIIISIPVFKSMGKNGN